MWPVDPPGVDVDARRHVDRDDGHLGEQRQRPLRLPLQPRAATDADDAVDEHVGVVGHRPVGDHTSAGATQGGQTFGVGVLGEQHRLDGRAAAGEQRSRPERVTAVVAPTDEEQHPGAVHPSQQVGDRHRQPGGGPLHQCPLGQVRHQRGLGGTHLLDGVGHLMRSR